MARVVLGQIITNVLQKTLHHSGVRNLIRHRSASRVPLLDLLFQCLKAFGGLLQALIRRGPIRQQNHPGLFDRREKGVTIARLVRSRIEGLQRLMNQPAPVVCFFPRHVIRIFQSCVTESCQPAQNVHEHVAGSVRQSGKITKEVAERVAALRRRAAAPFVLNGKEHGMDHAEAGGWLLTARDAWAFLAVWFVIALAHGLWRSRGDAPQDTIRESGPID